LSTFGPSIDVEDTDKEILVTADVPGLDSKDFTVTLSGDVLTIAGEKKDARDEKRGGFGSFSRSVRLPFNAGDEKVDAQYEKGVFTVRIPKPADLAKRSKRIEVRPG
jgi:HSP20 family protein